MTIAVETISLRLNDPIVSLSYLSLHALIVVTLQVSFVIFYNTKCQAIFSSPEAPKIDSGFTYMMCCFEKINGSIWCNIFYNKIYFTAIYTIISISY